MLVNDRAAGAVMGALIGDALGVGPHWYYDLDEMRRDYGDWITGYTDPQPQRYHAGLKLSQAGIITAMLLRSVVEKNGYDEDDFCRRLDEELFPQLDGTPMNGPADTPASQFGKRGAGASKRRNPGKKRAGTPTRLRLRSVRWCLRHGMRKHLRESRRPSAQIVC